MDVRSLLMASSVLLLLVGLFLVLSLQGWRVLALRVADLEVQVAQHAKPEAAWQAHPHVHRLPSAEEHAAAQQRGGPEHTSAAINHLSHVDDQGLRHTRGVSATFIDWSQTSDFGVAPRTLADLVEQRKVGVRARVAQHRADGRA